VPFFFFRKKEAKKAVAHKNKNTQQFLLLKWTASRRPKVSSLKLIWLTTLIFCLRHRCTKNQSLQVFGRVEQRLKSSEVLQTSPPKFFLQLCSASLHEEEKTSLNRDVQRQTINFYITYSYSNQ